MIGHNKKINFFITSGLFPSISVTGNSCGLSCKHCRGKLLEPLIHAKTCKELERIAMKLNKNGAKGMLLTGGCNCRGRVPISDFIPAIRNIKQRTDLILIAHTGLISPKEAIDLKFSGLDGIGFDVVGDMDTVREVYGLDVSEKEYAESLRAIENSGMMIFPHICVGLHYGRLRGEFKALEMIRDMRPLSVIITGLMPVPGTPMEHIRPKPIDFSEVISKAIEMFPNIPVVLGCAHSAGKDRGEIERLAISSGVSGIAVPTKHTVDLVRENGYEIKYFGTCCGLAPGERTRIG